MIRILFMASFLFFVICGCNSQTGGIKGKKQNEQFFDKSFVLKDLSPYDTEYNISRMAGWVKVGQTYTFSKVNYKDRYWNLPQFGDKHT